MITNLKIAIYNINWSSALSHAIAVIVGFVGSLFIRFSALQKDRDKWKQYQLDTFSDFRKLKDMYVSQVDEKQQIIAQRDEALRLRDDALEHRQEIREKNYYMFAMLMREDIFKPEDHEYLNKKDIENITALFKKMKK